MNKDGTLLKGKSLYIHSHALPPLSAAIPLLVCLTLIFAGCFPDTQNTIIQENRLKNYKKITSPSKIFLKNGAVILMKEGFSIEGNELKGNGLKYSLDGTGKKTEKSSLTYNFELNNNEIFSGSIDSSSKDSIYIKSNSVLRKVPRAEIKNIELLSDMSNLTCEKISLDSVSAVTYYENKSNDIKDAASVSLGFFGSALTFLATYCTICPKCCFGSCPTVYTFDGNKFNLEAELFSECISKQLEDNDQDLLTEKIPADSIYKIKLTNEALETHYINKFSLIHIVHPQGTKVYPVMNNRIVAVKAPVPPSAVFNCMDRDVTALISNPDGSYYRSDTLMVKKLREEVFKDNLNFKMNAPYGCKNAKIVIRYRNTLMSTILFYDMVLGSQGVKAIDWIERMNTDMEYAAKFKLVYKIFSGISVKSNVDNKYTETGHFGDAGPINWKYAATVVPVNPDGILDVKLEFIPDNFMIDYIGVDFSETNPLSADTLIPYEIKDNLNRNRNDVLRLINTDDGHFLQTDPGECYYFSYKIPKNDTLENSILVASKGYYTEWIRGKWITASDNPFEFSLYNIGPTVKELAFRWLEDRNMMETEFFKNKIPIKGVN